jgi:hypothetical protein
MTKRYIVSCIVPGAKPNEAFLQSMSTYADKHKAEILFIESTPPYKKDIFDPLFLEYGTVLEHDLKLNDNLAISLLPINPEQSDPITGLDRLSNNESSIIYASPKQRLKSVASPTNAYPRVLMTPGAATLPYTKNSQRGIVAALDHVNGAIIVEVTSNKYYHFRQVQANKDGSFVDLGVRYSKNGTSTVKTESIVFGDWHTGYTDPVVRQCSFEMVKHFKPRRLFFHDFFDGISVNHHIDHKLVTKARLSNINHNDLSRELKLCANELQEFNKLTNAELVITKSNHDEFLDRWLEEGKYVDDALNHEIGLELALAKVRGKDPLESGIRKFAKLKNVTFLKSDDSFKVSRARIECGVHGHLGPDGARGSSASLEKSYINIVFGHRHSPEIQRSAWVVGTSSHLKLDYNKGPSSWMQTHCVIYDDGSRQLINIINSTWKAK